MSPRTSTPPAVASAAAAAADTPQLHRGTNHVHIPATVSELGRVSLPSGRDVVFRHVRFGQGHALDIATIREDGREHHVRVPAGCLRALAEALAIVLEAQERSLPGRGVPRGRTTPPIPPVRHRKDPRK